MNYIYDEVKFYLIVKVIRKIRVEDKEKKVYGVDEVLVILEFKNVEVVFDIKEMLKYKIIVKKFLGVYVYGEFFLGLNLD